MLNDKEALLQIIGENIRRHRKSRGWSQEHLANMADVDRTYIGYVENAKYNVTIGFLCDIANALEMNLYDLLKVLHDGAQNGE